MVPKRRAIQTRGLFQIRAAVPNCTKICRQYLDIHINIYIYRE